MIAELSRSLQPRATPARRSPLPSRSRRRRLIEAHVLGTVAESHVYVDDGISGANFVTRSLLGLVAAAKTTPRPFDVLVAMDVDRVGREQFRTNVALLDIVEAV